LQDEQKGGEQAMLPTRETLNRLPKNGEDCEHCKGWRELDVAYCPKCGKKLRPDVAPSGDHDSEK
jgi:predicted amidophosphoribosyltransferase